MTAFGAADGGRAERRWVLIGLVVVAALLWVEVVAGMIRDAVVGTPSFLEKVQTCLAERATPYGPVVGDPVALSAARGALRTTVRGNSVVVALGGSEKDAKRVYGDYADVAPPEVVRTRLELNRKVVFLWSNEPTAEQREFMRICTLDAQE